MADTGSKYSVIVLVAVVALASGRSINVADSKKRPYTLEETFTLRSNGFDAKWSNDAINIIYRDVSSGNIMRMNTETNATESLVEASVLRKYNSSSYSMSYSMDHILIGYDRQESYRHSFLSRYVVYSLKTKQYMDVASKALLQHAAWTLKKDRLIYIKDNNMYLTDSYKGGETYAITRNGIPGQVFNGVCDWVYEEEVLGKGTSYSISPDGTQMLYTTFDTRNVTDYKFLVYGEPGNMAGQYETEVTIPYPKPGTPITLYQVRHFNFTDRSTRLISESKPGREIMFGYNWASNNMVAVNYLNRAQNEVNTDLCDLTRRTCSKVYQEVNPRGWAIQDKAFFSPDGQTFIRRVHQKFGSDEYIHIQLFGPGGQRKSLTNGTFMVTKIIEWNVARGKVFFVSNEPGLPSTEHVYMVRDDGSQSEICLTCQIMSPEGVRCQSGSITFPNSEHTGRFIGRCNGPTPPFVGLYDMNGGKVTMERLLDDNTRLRQSIKDKLSPGVLNLRVEVTKGIEAEVRLYLPPGADTSGATKYPMVVYVYGGPDNPQVHDRFGVGYGEYMTTNRSIIYAIIDGRGTGRKGANMMYAMYKKMGTVEIEDQITATRYLRDNIPFIDRKRIGIWGWSYGGYATTKVLEDDIGGVFSCGAAVAPVSDWIYYNSIYTERYMDTPARNPEGYRRASTLYNVDSIGDREYLLIHGTGDDNVHYQHAMHLAKALQRRGILFDQQSYADEAHGISGLKLHVYQTIDRFWSKCFRL